MATKVYGQSDDLIEFEGDVYGEIGHYADEPRHLIFSDGTILSAHYGEHGIWRLSLVKKGSLLEAIDYCLDADADLHSDVARFKDGLTYAYHTTSLDLVE